MKQSHINHLYERNKIFTKRQTAEHHADKFTHNLVSDNGKLKINIIKMNQLQEALNYHQKYKTMYL